MLASNITSRSQHHTVTGEITSQATLPRGPVNLRAMTTNDGQLLKPFFRSLSPLARHRRFMSPMRDVPDHLLDLLSGVDQVRHVGYLAETIVNDQPVMIAEARYVIEHLGDRHGDFALAVADTWQGHGIGRALLSCLEQHAIDAGCAELIADTLADNRTMIGLAKCQGFTVGRNPYDSRTTIMTKRLTLH